MWAKFYWRQVLRLAPNTKTRHIEALAATVLLQKACSQLRLRMFLYKGTLLGSVRQGSFAGRPSDADFIIPCQDRDILALKKYLSETAYVHAMKQTGPASYHIDLQPSPPWWPGWLPSWTRPRPITLDIFLQDATHCPVCGGFHEAELYGYPFKIPTNWRDILDELYGASWCDPDSRQYGWSFPIVRECLQSNKY